MIGRVTKCEEAVGEKSGISYLKVTVAGEGVSTSFNTFDNETVKTMDFFKRAFAEGYFIDIDTEKSGKYTNLKSFKLVKDELPQVKPPVSHTEAPKQDKPSAYAGTTPFPAKTDKQMELIYKNRSMAIAYAKDLVVAGKIELEQITVIAQKFLLFIESGKV